MYSGNNSLFWKDDAVFFSGYSYGFETYLQTMESEANVPNYYTYVYKYRFDEANECLFLKQTSFNEFQAVWKTKKGVHLKEEGWFTLHKFDDVSPLSKAETPPLDLIRSKSTSAALLNSMTIPRPCAF